MAVSLTGSAVNFNDGTQQFSAAGTELLLRSNIVSGTMTFDYTGMYNEGLRNLYQSLHVKLTDVTNNGDENSFYNYCLQFRWTDGAGNYGWAETSSTPYRYPNLRYTLRGLNISGSVSSSAVSSFGDNKIVIGDSHGNLNSNIDILGLNDFDTDVIFYSYGTHYSGHMVTHGGAKVENRSGSARVIDGFRFFIFGGTTSLGGGVVSIYGVRR